MRIVQYACAAAAVFMTASISFASNDLTQCAIGIDDGNNYFSLSDEGSVREEVDAVTGVRRVRFRFYAEIPEGRYVGAMLAFTCRVNTDCALVIYQYRRDRYANDFGYTQSVTWRVGERAPSTLLSRRLSSPEEYGYYDQGTIIRSWLSALETPQQTILFNGSNIGGSQRITDRASSDAFQSFMRFRRGEVTSIEEICNERTAALMAAREAALPNSSTELTSLESLVEMAGLQEIEDREPVAVGEVAHVSGWAVFRDANGYVSVGITPLPNTISQTNSRHSFMITCPAGSHSLGGCVYQALEANDVRVGSVSVSGLFEITRAGEIGYGNGPRQLEANELVQILQSAISANSDEPVELTTYGPGTEYSPRLASAPFPPTAAALFVRTMALVALETGSQPTDQPKRDTKPIQMSETLPDRLTLISAQKA